MKKKVMTFAHQTPCAPVHGGIIMIIVIDHDKNPLL